MLSRGSWILARTLFCQTSSLNCANIVRCCHSESTKFPRLNEFKEHSSELSEQEPHSYIAEYLESRIFDENLTVDTFAPLYQNADDPSTVRSQIKHILLTYDHAKYTEEAMVPRTLTLKDMKGLLLTIGEETKELQRRLRYLYAYELDQLKCKQKKAELRKINAEKRKSLYGGPPVKFESTTIWEDSTERSLKYGLWANCAVGRISSKAIQRHKHRQYIRLSHEFGQKLIIDLAYDEHMTYNEICQLCFQIDSLINYNRYKSMSIGAIPFDIHFTNCASAGLTMKTLPKYAKNIDSMKPSLFHEGSYLDQPELFPRDRLVYLSPHASQPLLEYSHDDIYILGGYNDRTSNMRVSHLKAAKEDIRCYSLPLNKFVSWKQGNKKLCLNQMIPLLQEVSLTGDWAAAISHTVPSRKMWSKEELVMIDEERRRRLERRNRSIANSYKTAYGLGNDSYNR